MKVRPFSIDIPGERLDDLQARLRAARWPTGSPAASWEDGADLAFMQRVVAYWRDAFDWREQERRLNRMPHVLATLDGADIHFLHQPGRGPDPLPIVITHGWPGSFVEMLRLLPLLADPEGHGGDPADAFHVVVPSLPGYGFSAAPAAAGMNSRRIAGLWHGLMAGLGYSRYGAQGGDIGASVSAWLARDRPDAVIGAHLNFIPGSYRPPLGVGSPPVSLEEQAYLDRVAGWTALEGAYAHLHATKPQTLSYALTDSPTGLAAWMLEKFQSWSDNDGDIERVFGLDTLLTNVSLHWFGQVAGSLRLYKENRLAPLSFDEGERVGPPLAIAVFPREVAMPPRSWVDRAFNVQRWTVMPRGGHFAALEEPELLAKDIREFFRPMRGHVGRHLREGPLVA